MMDSLGKDNYRKLMDNWEYIKEAVRDRYEVSKNAYDYWIAPLALAGFENGVVQICIPRGMEQCIGYLSNEYMDYFKTAIKDTLNLNVDIRFVNKTESENKMINLNHSFANFMVNQTNDFAAQVCKSFAESVGSSFNSLLIFGDTGVGKTHLVQATINRILELNPSINMKYVTSESFANEWIEAISNRGNGSSTLRKEYRNLDILVLDNLEYLNNMARTKSELFYTIDEILRKGKSVIFTSNCNPRYLFDDCPKFKVRLEGFCSIGIDSPDDDLISQIVDRTLDDMGFSLDGDVKAYIIQYGDKNIRKTVGALNTLKAYVDIKNNNPWLQDVKRLFE